LDEFLKQKLMWSSYSRINFRWSPDSRAGKVSESRLMSQARRARKTVCA